MNQKTVYLASFQKSGNTWVSFILANIYNLMENKFREIDFFNIHRINPEYKENQEPAYEFKGFPLIQTTHAHFKETFDNVILLIRNPWDTLFSYFHYLRGERLMTVSIEDVIKDKKRGIEGIVSHNLSFLRNHKRMIIITYENLSNHPIRETRKMIEFLGINIQESCIKNAVKKASFKSMRYIEINKGRKFGNPNFIFTRKGKIGEGQKYFQKHKDLNEYILEEIKKSPLLYLHYGDSCEK